MITGNVRMGSKMVFPMWKW